MAAGDGRVMVPLRFLAQQLGLRVGWDQATRRATIAKPGLTASFLLDCHYFVLNGRLRYLDVPARSVGGRTLVPLRYAAKALGVAIDWMADSRTVSVDVTRSYVEPETPAATGNLAYLTFDDGPDPSMTPRVLTALAENDVKATFFVIGSCVRGNPSLTERIVAAGHALGNHSFSHITSRSNTRWIYASPAAYLAELAACDRAISDATGLTVRVSRPPGGSAPWVTAEFRAAIADAGYSTYDWDASVADSSWPRPTVEQIISNVIAGSRGGKRQRLIILMHDGGRDHSSTLAALPVIIEYLRQCGYTFATLR
jgi:peptidoglycan/xylan/chitin deacetylase (PgdA/CDA1 family)